MENSSWNLEGNEIFEYAAENVKLQLNSFHPTRISPVSETGKKQDSSFSNLSGNSGFSEENAIEETEISHLYFNKDSGYDSLELLNLKRHETLTTTDDQSAKKNQRHGTKHRLDAEDKISRKKAKLCFSSDEIFLRLSILKPNNFNKDTSVEIVKEYLRMLFRDVERKLLKEQRVTPGIVSQLEIIVPVIEKLLSLNNDHSFGKEYLSFILQETFGFLYKNHQKQLMVREIGFYLLKKLCESSSICEAVIEELVKVLRRLSTETLKDKHDFLFLTSVLEVTLNMFRKILIYSPREECTEMKINYKQKLEIFKWAKLDVEMKMFKWMKELENIKTDCSQVRYVITKCINLLDVT